MTVAPGDSSSTDEPRDGGATPPGPPSREVSPSDSSPTDGLPDDVADAIEATVEQVVLERYSSQFPHPEHLERYAALYPDAPRLVFENFDAQSKHRRDMEEIFINGNERRANRGQILAFVIVIVAFIIGLVAILNGNAVTGGVIIGGAFTGGIVLYVAGGARSPAPARAQTNERDSAKARRGSIRRTRGGDR